MPLESNYANVQQPSPDYGSSTKQPSDGYGMYQNPLSLYQGAAPPPLLTAGLGNGVNLQPSYYNGGNVDFGWTLMKADQKIKSVRIEIEPGQQANAQRWIKEAVANGYAVIATYHKVAVLGTDVVDELLAAADWWTANYASLKTSGSFMINLMNEWGSHDISEKDFASAYNQAIARVRSVYNGPIIIDIPGYGQEAHTAFLAVSGTSGQTITDRKIILSAHIYPNAWNKRRNRGMDKSDMNELISTGLACIVGEFGDNRKGGNTPWYDLVMYAKSKQWPVFGWAWNGDGGNMNMITPQFQAFVAGQPKQYTKTAAYFNTIDNCL